jgi:hypothetical protein
MKQYKILTAPNVKELNELINSLAKEDWILQDVKFCNSVGNYTHYLAVMKQNL